MKYLKIPGLDKVKAGEGVFFPGRSLRQHLYQRGSHKSLDDGGEDDEIYRDIIMTKSRSISTVECSGATCTRIFFKLFFQNR